MSRIEIQKGILVSFEDFVRGATQMDDKHLEQFVQKLGTILKKRKTPFSNEKEQQLLHTIYQKSPENIQVNYDLLYAKLQNETISEQEHKELLKLVELSEQQRTKWLEAMISLAQLRGLTLEELRQELGFENYIPS